MNSDQEHKYSMMELELIHLHSHVDSLELCMHRVRNGAGEEDRCEETLNKYLEALDLAHSARRMHRWEMWHLRYNTEGKIDGQ